jgi:DNA sulfur modification protein DndE
MPIETIRVSEQARDQLLSLRKATGIAQWNILCRWAFCHSLQNPRPPVEVKILSDSSVEMSWKVFGGKFADLYWALLRCRVAEDGGILSEDNLNAQFRIHLHRGIESVARQLRKNTLRELLGAPLDWKRVVVVDSDQPVLAPKD